MSEPGTLQFGAFELNSTASEQAVATFAQLSGDKLLGVGGSSSRA